MLTSEESQPRLKALIVLTSITLASLISGLTIMLVSKYYGFSAGNPITCTATATNAYFVHKYSKGEYVLSSSFVGMLISFGCALAVLIVSIRRLVELNK